MSKDMEQKLPIYNLWIAGLNLFLTGFCIGKSDAALASIFLAGFVISSAAYRYTRKNAKSNCDTDTQNEKRTQENEVD
ncbi:hypothetical protein [Butyrivibrio hungatei]|uniref:Uncharacterized protein n=1 Tax=Butyrivibrio hungatei TaxID=185008 RepID=A0A1D9P5W2_9FIRM|nr:hypothetical protein [Butyrivibrio hungatei]AOZ97882.1 hypothetical protein bhn_II083 [Butyrivibrio hungatei]